MSKSLFGGILSPVHTSNDRYYVHNKLYHREKTNKQESNYYNQDVAMEWNASNGDIFTMTGHNNQGYFMNDALFTTKNIFKRSIFLYFNQRHASELLSMLCIFSLLLMIVLSMYYRKKKRENQQQQQQQQHDEQKEEKDLEQKHSKYSLESIDNPSCYYEFTSDMEESASRMDVYNKYNSTEKEGDVISPLIPLTIKSNDQYQDEPLEHQQSQTLTHIYAVPCRSYS